jgi:hypothetical protein
LSLESPNDDGVQISLDGAIVGRASLADLAVQLVQISVSNYMHVCVMKYLPRDIYGLIGLCDLQKGFDDVGMTLDEERPTAGMVCIRTHGGAKC